MNLFNLPCDIKYHITENFLRNNNKRLLNTSGFYNGIHKTDITKNIVNTKNKLALYFLIKYNQMKLFRKIDMILKYHFKNFIGGMISFNDNCLIYAPVTQYGKCRFCCKEFNDHRYGKMIDVYLSLTNQNEY